MDKDEVRSFLSFLETASWNELLGHQKKLVKVLEVVVHDDTRADAKFCLRLVDEELAARTEIEKVADGG